MKSKYVQYYVEGEDEKHLIDVLKSKLKIIRPGKVQKLNVIEQEITNLHLRTFKPDTMVVLVFDTDTGNAQTLRKNLQRLEKCPSVSEIITIPQVSNLEDELVRSCDIRTAPELLGSKSIRDFKRDFIRVSNLDQKLLEHNFDIHLLWTGTPLPPYQNIVNQSRSIKLI